MDDSEIVARDAAGTFGVKDLAPPRQARSRATRLELVSAAREIFARDGFEQARLEDISAAAGKTRGAFYAHFQDKEDVFFALFEEDLAQDQQKVRALLRGKASVQERIQALAMLLEKVLKNRKRMLLAIEFKLYAIRRPHHKRLAALHGAMKMRCAEAHIDELLPELQGQPSARKRGTAAQFSALIDGLALNRLFDPQAIGEVPLRLLLENGIRAVLELGRMETE